MSDRVLHVFSLVAALVIVAGGLYAVLDKAAPLVGTRPPQPPKVQEPAPAPPVPAPSTVTQKSASNGPTIFRCESNGGAVYSDTPCKGGRVVDVQIPRGFDSTRDDSAESSPVRVEPSRVPAQPVTAVQTDVQANAGLCRQIHEAIAAIDAAARAGGSAVYQDDLRQRRHKLVEKRQELRC